MGEVTKIPEPTQQKLKKAKARIRLVGIYARVSTNRQAQLHSMAAQVSELTRFVSNRPEWKLTDIYLDFDSSSGTKMRSEFYRMIDDAKNRKVDVIITKSIQRFGRNTVENVETMRTLVESGVVVYFQIEGITSDQPDAELQATLYSALAQADNASHRDERAWGVTSPGKPRTVHRKCTNGHVTAISKMPMVFWLLTERRHLSSRKSTLPTLMVPASAE